MITMDEIADYAIDAIKNFIRAARLGVQKSPDVEMTISVKINDEESELKIPPHVIPVIALQTVKEIMRDLGPFKEFRDKLPEESRQILENLYEKSPAN